MVPNCFKFAQNRHKNIVLVTLCQKSLPEISTTNNRWHPPKYHESKLFRLLSFREDRPQNLLWGLLALKVKIGSTYQNLSGSLKWRSGKWLKYGYYLNGFFSLSSFLRKNERKVSSQIVRAYNQDLHIFD